MQRIIPHLWFDTQAEAAATWYTSLFLDSGIQHVNTIPGTPSGDAKVVSFTLAGLEFQAISAGPYFKLNPAISLSVSCESDEEIDTLWAKLSEGGVELMPLQSYPWAKKYGWIQDRYGLTWQLSLTDTYDGAQKIVPFLLFANAVHGKAKEAVALYTSLFSDSSLGEVVHREGSTLIPFTLAGEHFMVLDNSYPHEFGFNEAFSLMIMCDTQDEIDFFWKQLSAVPEAEQCGWVKDMYGVSWQIVPRVMNEMMAKGSKEQIARVTQAFLQMKKFDVAALERAYSGE